MVFNNKLRFQPKIQLGNEYLPVVTHTKFLGVLIDNRLTWNEHATKLLLKLKSRVGMLGKSTNLLGNYAQKILYKSKIHSNLSYGLVEWGNMITKHDLNKLSKVQDNV